MDTKHVFSRGSSILQSEVDEEVKVIIDYLKTKKQTYTVNKFVLKTAIDELGETAVSQIMS